MNNEVKDGYIQPTTELPLSPNPNQWILDIIPNTLHDKDYFIEQVLFNALIDFWENEEGEESLRYQFEREPDDWMTPQAIEAYELTRIHNKKVYDELKEAYEWAKSRKEDTRFEFDDDIFDSNTKHLNTIIKHRDRLWV